MPKRVWTDEMKALLIQCFTVEGLSFSHIAARMNVTRNAVAGIVCRLGLNGQGCNPGLPRRSLNPRPRPPSKPEERRLPIAVCEGCVWPIGDPGDNAFRFCGAAVAGRQSYCAEHTERAYLRESAAAASARRAKAAERGARAYRPSSSGTAPF
ncbi:MAG: hypothetical protein HYR63_23710 [Proteobacteria bacterium]|nr:hypothetical protein [Pseudomonadota bacterium]